MSVWLDKARARVSARFGTPAADRPSTEAGAFDRFDTRHSPAEIVPKMPMAETANIRKERIERLLHDLQYEITRGIMDREIDEHLGFRFMLPSPSMADGMVVARFVVEPMHRSRALYLSPDDGVPKLRVVK